MLVGSILELRPSAVYEEVVYTQSVIIECINGSKLCVFDPRMLCEKRDIGEKREMDISVPITSSIDIIDERKNKIIPFVDGNGNITSNADIFGTIIKIIRSINDEKGFPHAVLDVGLGTLIVELDKVGSELVFEEKERLEIFKEGMNIRIKGGCLYLDRIIRNE